MGYCENSKAYRIYIPGQRKVKISRDVRFDEDATIGKVRDLPLPPPPKGDDWDILDSPFVLESDIDDDPMEPMDPLDPPPSDPPTRKRLLWLRDTLHDAKKHVPV